MSGKTCLVTGATGGIGRATAAGLASQGAAVVITARDAERGAAAAAEIRRLVPGASVDVVTGDLSDMHQVRGLALQVRDSCERLDVLVNNAGVITMGRQLTTDGLDRMFAVNHLAPFLLTTLLTGLLARSAPARIVTVASAAHRQTRAIPWDDLPTTGDYALTKLLNILFTAQLARRLHGTGVTANCLHPGFVRTGLGREMPSLLGAALGVVLLLRPGAATGARTSIYLASAPEAADANGGYFVKCRPARPSALAADPDAARRLWSLSEALVAEWQ